MSDDYLARARKNSEYARKTDLELELIFARRYDVEKLTGLTKEEHRIRRHKLLFPSRINHPWRDRYFGGLQFCLDRRIKEFMNIGSANSTKTSSIADSIVDLWFQRPEATSVYITSPYKDATSTGVWARIIEQFHEAKDHNPELPGIVRPSTFTIRLDESNPLGFIKVVTVDEVGKLVGKKSRLFGQGHLIIGADELPEFPARGQPLVRVMFNLRSVPNILLIGAGNFADPNDALGRFCEPSEDSIPGGYIAIDADKHQEWRSSRGGLVYRYDGHLSPNVLAGKDYLPFVTTIEYLEDLAKTSGSVKSPEYYRYGRSCPLVDQNEFTVTNAAKLRSGGALDSTTEFTGDKVLELLSVDPGFGGDPCVLLHLRICHVKTADGRLQALELLKDPIVIPIDVTSELTADDQIAVFVREYAEREKIPFSHVGFDGSMRSGIVQAFLTKCSMHVVPIDAGGKPSNRPVHYGAMSPEEAKKNLRKTWRQEADRYVTEMWMVCGSLIASSQLRGLHRSRAVQEQLCKRRWRWSAGHKKQLETKDEYKENNKSAGSGRSPNEADALTIGVELARRLGLRPIGISGSSQGVLEKLRQIAFEASVQAMLRNVNRANGLPSGKLHGMAPVAENKRPSTIKTLPAGRLHSQTLRK